jgi:small subunit ribosomal protein S13
MIRISGVTLDPKKQARFALTPIKGVGKSNVKVILSALGINPTTLLGDVEEEKIIELRNYLESNYLVEADLRRQKQADIKRLIDINSWRGGRHKVGLPVRGQTTKVNSRTVRGNKRGSGASGKAKPAQKT